MIPTTLQLLRLPDPLYSTHRLALAFEDQWGRPATIGELAASGGLDEATVATSLAALESQGFVCRLWGGDRFEAVMPTIGEVT